MPPTGGTLALLAAREFAVRQACETAEKHLAKSEILAPQLGRGGAFQEANGKLSVSGHGAAHNFNQRNASGGNACADIVTTGAKRFSLRPGLR